MSNNVKGSLTVERLTYLGNMTTAVRDNITPNGPGALIWNTTANQLEVWDGTAWDTIGNAPVTSVNGQIGVVVLAGGDIGLTPLGNQTESDVQAAIDAMQTAIDNNTASAAADNYNAYNGVPPNAEGNDGDFGLDATTGDLYEKIAGVWTATGDNVFSTALSNATPEPLGAAASAGTGQLAAREDHVHEAPTIEQLNGDFGAAATAATAGQTIVKDATTGLWVAKDAACPPYQAPFVTGDWVPGTSNTFTVPLATHGLPYQTGQIYDIEVADNAGNIVTVCRQTLTGGDVVVTTDGAVFPGTISIQL